VRDIKTHFPASRLYLLTVRQGMGILAGNPQLDGIIELPGGKAGWISVVRRLRKERFDTALVLHRFFAATLLMVVAGVPQRLGFYWKRHGFALTAGLPFSPTKPQVEQICNLMTLLRKPAAEPESQVFIPAEKSRQCQDLLRQWGYDPGRLLIGIHPGGGVTAGLSHPSRRWVAERFGQLADMLIRRDQAQVLLLEGPGDQTVIAATRASMTHEPLQGEDDVVSRLDLLTFAAVLRSCNLVVTNDTGPLQLAASLTVPVVAVFGPTHPNYNCPTGNRHTIVWAGVDCSPCFNFEDFAAARPWRGQNVFECWRGTHDCMLAVTAEDVYQAVKSRLEAEKVLTQRSSG
jgi:ADP-heptose:LPS heptosyltransferase